MKRFTKKVLLALTLLTALCAFSTSLAAAQTKQDVCRGVAAAGASCTGGGTSVNDVIGVVVNILSTLVGIVAVIMIIIAGYKYITSGGDSSNIASAKNTLLFAIVGLVLVAMAQSIVRFVLDKAT